MKRLVIVRHAKTIQYGYENDFERYLTDVGRTDAQIISSKLAEKKIIPDLVVSSPAKRALETAEIFSNSVNYSVENIIRVADIYDGLTTKEFLKLIQNFQNEFNTVFIVGHNPGLEYFTVNLLEINTVEMPTCSTVGIDFQVDNWNEIELNSGKMLFHFIPKMFRK